ncbi:MAG TPA: preprotein translocase subunit SecE [Candidatus Paceibacterota bacterium]
MAQVSWPSRKETINLTIVVVVVSLVTAAFLGLFDYIFSLVLQKFIL